MNKEEFYIKIIQPIREFCSHSDKEDVYMYIYNLQQENKQLKEKLDKYKEVISKFKDLKTLIGILNSNNLRFSFNEILQELEKGDSND